MSERFTGQRMLMRIFIGESDRAQDAKHKGKPLWEALLHEFRDRGLAGATVTRAIAGFGANAKIRTSLVEFLSLDLPIVIEVVETEENIRAVLPELDSLMGAGLVTLERVEVIIYRATDHSG